MLRTVAAVALLALLALVAFHLITGIVGGALGVVLAIAWLVFKVLLVAGLAYFVLSLVAPETARKMRDRVARKPNI